MRNWRDLPAKTVQEILTYHCRCWPPTLKQLWQLATRYNYVVLLWPAEVLPDAMTDMTAQVIDLPLRSDAELHTMLLHELAEILLRLPVAPEFHYLPTGYDEHHQVARIGKIRL